MASDPPPDPAGALLIRAWVERHPDAPLRAVISHLGDQDGAEVASTALSSVDEVCEFVRSWLNDLLDRDSRS